MRSNRIAGSAGSFALLTAFLVLGSGIRAQEGPSGGQPDTPEQTILRLESERYRAMEQADTLALGRFLAPDLTYVHSNGIQDGRASFLGKIASKAIEYGSISPERIEARISGGTAIVTGTTRMKVKALGRELSLHSVFTSVYVRAAGAGRAGGSAGESWRLVAYQSTPIPEK